MSRVWEDNISLNSRLEPRFNVLPSAAELIRDQQIAGKLTAEAKEAAARDVYPIPEPGDREGYYGDDHISYWLSGYWDSRHLLEAAQENGVQVRRYLDLGCASGRVIRHVVVQNPPISTLGCDINRAHVVWCNRHLPSHCTVFQNHSIPTLPLQDNSVDLASAYSVFTHIEAFETTWLMELHRLLSPGGIAWLTFHTELTLAAIDETWPLWSPVMNHPEAPQILDGNRYFEGDRAVFRWHDDQSYSANVFYKKEYIGRVLESMFDIIQFKHRFPEYQDVFIVRKRP